MKKSAKKRIMAIAIVLTFGLSSVAYVVTSLAGPPKNEFKPLDKFVVDGEVDPVVEAEYYRNGYTFVKFYYTDLNDVIPFVDQLPDLFKTANDQVQLIVEKIQYNETYVKISSLNGDDTIYNITEEEIQKSLCNILLSAPVECVIANMNLTETTINTNTTYNKTNSSS